MNRKYCLVLLALVEVCFHGSLSAQDTPKGKPEPIKALLITGGCCHDYVRQKNILKQGIESRAMVEVTHIHSTDTSTKARFGIYDNPDWAQGYDIVLHDECSADILEQPYVERILAAHRNGLPAVNLHCAMHSYRIPGIDDWFQFVGIQSTSHGPQRPIEISYLDRSHPVTMALENWTTINEELYNNVKLFPAAKPLARGRQDVGDRVEDFVVAWTNEYGKGRVFSTTLGHNNETISDPRYLSLITRGLLWACGKLTPDYLQPFAQPKTEVVPINLALKKPSTASASQEGHPPEHAVDGKSETRWCSPDGNAGQWWQVDLGQPEDLTGCQVEWEMDGVNYRYRIEGSVDGSVWDLLSDQTGSQEKEQLQRLSFNAKGVRYVRLTTTGLTPGCWGSFLEFEVYGTKTETRVVRSDVTLRPRRVAGLDGVKVPPGFLATIFAGPPDVSYPTCVAATPDGTVYVGIDENGSIDRQPDRGRIVRCRDLDGDGKADEFKTFAKIDSPRGIIVVPDREKDSRQNRTTEKTTLIVLHPPTLSAFHDENGDGVSDRSEVLVQGIGFDLGYRGADHTTNGIQVGIDGWIYVAVGDYGFIKAIGRDQKSAQLRGGGIVRVRPDGCELEIVSRGQRNIYDVAVSPTMDLFTRDNTNDGGGWNVRLSHVPQDAQMGYPSLFLNFAEEIVEPLADYGGGSPCGSLFVNEPALPGELRHQLLTCDWGRSVVYRHPLTANGAGYRAEQEPFIEVPRPTDIDVDSNGNLYVSSWKDGGFTFSGPNVGYVLKVHPTSFTPPPTARGPLSEMKLVALMASDSHTVRLNAQREILKRGPTEGFVSSLQQQAAASQLSIPARVAAIFTLKQLLKEQSHPALLALAQDPVIREYALKAMADRRSQLSGTSIAPFVDALQDRNPRVRLVGARAIERFAGAGSIPTEELRQATEKLVLLTADPDPLVAHVAIHSLKEMNAVAACLAALDSPRVEVQVGATRVLRHLHDEATIQGFTAWLASDSCNAASREGTSTRATRISVLTALCRLHSMEADWSGDWWSTRPDTSGPYYKAVAWAESDRIASALKLELNSADSNIIRALLVELRRHKIELPEVQELAVKQGEEHPEFLSSAIEIIAALNSDLTPQTASLLHRVAVSKDSDQTLRVRALRVLIRFVEQPLVLEQAFESFASVTDAEQQGEVGHAWEEFVREPKLVQQVHAIAERRLRGGQAQPWLEASMELTYAILASIADNRQAGKAERDVAQQALELAWQTDAATIAALRGIGRSRNESQSLQVRRLRSAKNPEVQRAAEFAASRMELDRDHAVDPAKPLLGSMTFEDATAATLPLNGDVRMGARLFSRQGCSGCHTVSPNEPLKGPLLQDITKRYKKEELIESIMKPSAKIAQGFESQFFQTHDGKVYDGFVVRESGDEVEFRNVAGLATVLKKSEIEERGRREASIMPLGLVEKLNADQLAAILAYLDSLRK